MNIEKMTRKQFEELPQLKKYFSEYEFDSLVLIPTKIRHNSGFNYYDIALCNNFEPIGKVGLYDTFSIFASKQEDRIGIDCLPCGFMRIFLQPETYSANICFHEAKWRNK